MEAWWDTDNNSVGVCDSNDRETKIYVSEADWNAFVKGAGDGQFDLAVLKFKAGEAATATP